MNRYDDPNNPYRRPHAYRYGSQGYPRQYPQAYPQQADRAYTRSFGQGGQQYPGIAEPFGGPGAGGGGFGQGAGGAGGFGQGGNLPVPYQSGGQPFGGGTPGAGGFGGLGQSGGGSGGSKFNFNDIKNLVDRMGGIDGIMNTVTKFQRLFQTVQQMSPMLKLLMGSFLKKGATASSGKSANTIRRRRRRRTGGSRRPQSQGNGRRRSTGRRTRPRRRR